MASNIPTPLLFVLASAVESFVITVLFKSYLPEHALLRVFFRLLGLQAVIFAIYKIVIYPRFLSPLRHLPHPKDAIPLLGNGLATFERPAGRSFSKWMAEIPNDGLIYFRGFFNADRLLVTSPKALAEIMVTRTYDFEKPGPLRNFLRLILGDGLIIVEGDMHKFLRKNTMPAFTFRSIKELYPIFWEKSVQLAQGVTQQIAENPELRDDGTKDVTSVVEVNHWANQVTMDIIGLAAMGRDFMSLKNGKDPLIVNYEELLEPTREKQIYFLCNMLFPQRLIQRLPWKMNERTRAITTNITNISLQLVADKKAAMKTEPENHKDILSLLLRSNNFSDHQLVDQLLTFLAAGHETTSSAFTWAAFLLAKHPLIQAALRAEVKAHIPAPGSPVPSDMDLAAVFEALPLLNGVCNETLRLYPTVPMTVRDSVRPTELAGTHIPAGIQIILSPWATNRSKEYWGEDANDFKPERWIDTDPKTGEKKPNNAGGAPSNYVNLTFLHGPRSCIGQGFAKAELRCLVAAFVGCFNLEMADPSEVVVPSGVVTTKPKNGMHLRLRTLDGW